MNQVFQNFMMVIVWVSVCISALLGVFMLVQAVLDPPRRPRFAGFAAIWFYLAAMDLLYPWLDRSTYELLRLAWCGGYVGSLLWLLEGRAPRAFAVALIAPGIGLIVWSLGWPELATTVAFPVAFAAAALAHLRHYRRVRGFASAVLTAYSVAMGVFCAIYYVSLQSGDGRVIGLGYAHWALLSLIALLFGWVQLPRELRGRAPVRAESSQAIALSLAVLIAEIGVISGMLVYLTWPPGVYLASTILMLGSTLAFYFHHRHRLVIYTDNIAALLEERTASLRDAQEALARQNEILAEKLKEQAREIQAKTEVIERQRRLELAAQTAGQAAHDIQNLISPVLAQIARLQSADEVSPEVRDGAERISAQMGHILELNHQLLTLSRRGRMDAHPVRLDELLGELPDRFPGKDLRIECREEIWIRGAWSQLSRAVTNLVTNAFEAQPAHFDRVDVRCRTAAIAETRRCHLGFLAPGRYVALTVEDYGPGIPDSIRERIFEPFFSSKTGRHRSGSGLGLSIVAAVAEDHHGVLDLKTGPEGTQFTLYLPEVPAPGGAADPERLSGTETLLVVDDDASILHHYGKILESAGYTVIPARSGIEALRILRGEQVDLVLLDLKMPRMTGLETFFGAVHLRPGIRAVIHSSYIDDDEAVQLRNLGADALLQKPAGRVELLRTLRQILDGIPDPARTVTEQSH